MTEEFAHEADASRYSLRDDGEIIAVVDYAINANSISFNHTFTNPKRRGRGYAAQIVEYAVTDVEKTSNRRIIPMCWYVAKWFDEHPERAGLLTRS